VPQLQLPFLDAPSVPAVMFVRMPSARRYILRVRPDGTFRVTIPRGGSKREAESFLQQHRGWAERERERVLAVHAPVVWREGDRILLRGVPHAITIDRSGAQPVLRLGDVAVRLGRIDDNLRPAAEAGLRGLARRELIPRVMELAAREGLHVARVLIRNQRSRWGSCSRRGVIALNFRLVQMPPHVRDYVLVHELMHLQQQNHSRGFWRLVERACPEFRECERWLRTDGKGLF
jgi:predicted metal-dependent hydrolase